MGGWGGGKSRQVGDRLTIRRVSPSHVLCVVRAELRRRALPRAGTLQILYQPV